MALAALLALAAAWAFSSAQAQSTCQLSGDLGTLSSNQTVQRFAVLGSSGSTCDYYTFELAGDGSVTVTVSASDFDERVAIGTADGSAFVRRDSYSSSAESLTQTLPAGRYSALAYGGRGGYMLTIRTGELEAPPPGTGSATQEPAGGQQTTPTGGQRTPQAGAGDGATVSGRVIARVLPLPDNDRRGRYRIEFGFLSTEVLASGSSRDAVVAANEHLLPPQRFLNEVSLLARSRANDRRWLRSSPVDVLPLEDDDAGLSGEPLLTGRIIARWNPTSGGTFRVEFGFLSNSAFEAAGDDTQRAAELYAERLPESRYLTQSTINRELRRDQPRWLASSVVEPEPKNGTDPHCGRVVINPAGVPLTLPRGERITDEAIATLYGELAETFTPVVVSGLPPGLTYDVDSSRADDCEYQVTVSGTIPPQTPARTYSAAITAEGAVGEPTTQTVSIRIDPTETTVVEWNGYNPATTSIGGAVGIVQPRVVSPIPAPPGVTWSFETRTTDVCSVNARTGALTLIGAGACQVTVTASAPGYKPATATAQVTVDPTTPCTISWSGYNPASVELGDAAPTILAPLCMVNGRVAYPEYRYSVAPASAGVCRVNEATGALTIMSSGECRILLTNVAKPPEYGAGTASASVQVNVDRTPVQWDGYSPASVQLGDTAPTLLPPTAPSSFIRFSYASITPSVCSVDLMSGALRLIAEGTCSVTLTASGDPNYQSAPVTRTVVVGRRVQAPRIDSLTCEPSQVRVGDSVTCTARLSGGELDLWDWSDSGGGSAGCVNTLCNESEHVSATIVQDTTSYTTTFSRPDSYTITLEVGNTAGRDSRSFAVQMRGPNRPPVCYDDDAPSLDLTLDVQPGSSRARIGVAQVCKDADGDVLTFSSRSSRPDVVSVTRPAGPGGDVEMRGLLYRHIAYITLTATDPDGLSDSVTFDVLVVRDIDNEPPRCSPMPDLNLDVHDDQEIDLNRYCSDPEGGRLTYFTRSSNSAVVRVYDPESWRLNLLIERGGTATITVTATDPDGASTDVEFEVRVRGEFTCSNLADIFTNAGDSAPRTHDLQCTGPATYSASSSSTSVATVAVSSSGRVTITVRGVGLAYIDVAATASDGRTWRQNDVEVVVNRGSGGGSEPSGGSEPPLVSPPYGYARCGSDAVRVYWFDTSTGMKHHLNMSWEDATRVINGWGERIIGHLSQADCDRWRTGTPLTTANYN